LSDDGEEKEENEDNSEAHEENEEHNEAVEVYTLPLVLSFSLYNSKLNFLL